MPVLDTTPDARCRRSGSFPMSLGSGSSRSLPITIRRPQPPAKVRSSTRPRRRHPPHALRAPMEPAVAPLRRRLHHAGRFQRFVADGVLVEIWTSSPRWPTARARQPLAAGPIAPEKAKLSFARKRAFENCTYRYFQGGIPVFPT